MDEVSINKTTAGNQDQPGIAGLGGTQFAVVWADHDTGTIKGQMLGVNAAPSGNEFNVNFPGTPGTNRQLPAVIETCQRLVFARIRKLTVPPPPLNRPPLSSETPTVPDTTFTAV